MRVKVAYTSSQLPFVPEHAFPLTDFVGSSAHVTFNGNRGIIMSTARPEVPHPCISQSKSREGM